MMTCLTYAWIHRISKLHRYWLRRDVFCHAFRPDCCPPEDNWQSARQYELTNNHKKAVES